ncbi:DUF4255 domain-containing protein [Micromonospora sp. CPCC 205711]|uniref:DUF4255 domain-containing protein n=1 Tax=Micromonospora sp. CPCC 205547 TaxID=3122400 RepID=UPI002FF2B971
MSTAYALAAVSAVLRGQLMAYLRAAGASSAVGGVSVSVGPPDRVAVGNLEANQVNLFLARVTRNPTWANLGPPPRDTAGADVAAPPLGVDLHYVASVYGHDPLTGDILLGHLLAMLHETPVLTRAAIRRALAPDPPDPTLPAPVADSRLADQFEQLRITTTNSPGGEESFRLWSAFSAPYRASVFFDVSVVLIDPVRGAREPLPVRAVTAGTVDAQVPEVDQVRADGPTGTPVTAGATLVVTGRHLVGADTRIRIGAAGAVPTSATAGELRVPLSAFDRPVPAGIAGLVVTHSVDLGDPPAPRPALSSDAVPVVYRPLVTVAPADVVVDSTRTVDGVALCTGAVTVTVDPRVGATQQATLSLTAADGGTVLAAPAGNGVAPGADDTDRIRFAFRDLPAGTYLARLRVDGVDSPLTADPSGRYTRPAVVL